MTHQLRDQPGQVDRRTGGLENMKIHTMQHSKVDRRTGGLEMNIIKDAGKDIVDRRTGGLEMFKRIRLAS